MPPRRALKPKRLDISKLKKATPEWAKESYRIAFRDFWREVSRFNTKNLNERIWRHETWPARRYLWFADWQLRNTLGRGYRKYLESPEFLIELKEMEDILRAARNNLMKIKKNDRMLEHKDIIKDAKEYLMRLKRVIIIK